MKSYEIYYHVSPEASITKFQGRYSPRFKTKGLFVSPKFSSIADSWAPFVYGKKHPRSTKNSFNDLYKNVTVYKLKIPKSIIKICQDLYSQRYREARVKVKDPMSIVGAWGWDLELFIPSEYLNSIEIIGHQTFDKVRDLDKLSRPHFEKNKDTSYIKYAEKALPNYAAKKYIEINNLLSASLISSSFEESKFIVSNFNSKELNKLVDFFVKKGEYGYSWWSDSRRVLLKEERKLIDQVYIDSTNQINQLKTFAKNVSNKQMLLDHKFDSNFAKMISCRFCPDRYLKSVKDCNGNNYLRCSACCKITYVK